MLLKIVLLRQTDTIEDAVSHNRITNKNIILMVWHYEFQDFLVAIKEN